MLPAQPCHLTGSMVALTAWKPEKQAAITWRRAFPTWCWKWKIFSTKKWTYTWEKLWSSRARFGLCNEWQVDSPPCSPGLRSAVLQKMVKKWHQFLGIKLWKIRSSSHFSLSYCLEHLNNIGLRTPNLAAYTDILWLLSAQARASNAS